MTDGTVDGYPGAGPPYPVRRSICEEGVVTVENAANGEGAAGDFVRLAGGPLFDAVIDEAGADI